MSQYAHRMVRSYLIGFSISFVLTLIVFAITSQQLNSSHATFSKSNFVLLIAGLAFAQLAAQLVYFFHLGKETKPRFNTIAFYSMAMVVGIIVIGTLWIMANLDYNMSPSNDIEYIQKEENITLPQNNSSHR